MLDIKFIQANQEQIALAIKNKNCDVDLSALLKLHEQRNAIMQSIEALNQQKKIQRCQF
jgi:seryl-tRNA synthetase